MMEQTTESLPIERSEGRMYPEHARGQYLSEIFEEDPTRNENEFAYLDGFQVIEVEEEAEERAERFMKGQRHLVNAFFSRRRNLLLRRTATLALIDPDRPETDFVLLWNLLQDRWFHADQKEEDEVHTWLSGLTEEDFRFLTADPDLDPEKIMAVGILPKDFRTMRLFSLTREKLLKFLIKRVNFFHPDEKEFEATLQREVPQIAAHWELDAAGLSEIARDERNGDACPRSAEHKRGTVE